jgi:hypothetical protein
VRPQATTRRERGRWRVAELDGNICHHPHRLRDPPRVSTGAARGTMTRNMSALSSELCRRARGWITLLALRICCVAHWLVDWTVERAIRAYR